MLARLVYSPLLHNRRASNNSCTVTITAADDALNVAKVLECASTFVS